MRLFAAVVALLGLYMFAIGPINLLWDKGIIRRSSLGFSFVRDIYEPLLGLGNATPIVRLPLGSYLDL